MGWAGRRVLVTGATGFLGSVLSEALLARGAKVRVSGRCREAAATFVARGAEFVPAELAELSQTRPLTRDVEVVFHCAALSSAWGPRDAFWRANVRGTRNIAHACTYHGVGRLVHVSTPSVYFRFEDQHDLSENAALPSRFVNDYARTKFIAEQCVQRSRLRSVILRPRAIFGVGDRALFPRLLRALEAGRLRVVGDGRTQIDLTQVENCVQGCLLAADADVPSGRVYNLSDGDPQELWPLLRHMAERLGYAPPRGQVSRTSARRLARSLERMHRAFGVRDEPLLTEYAAGILGYSMTLSIERARQELGYSPEGSSREAVDRFLESWRGR